MLQTPKARGFTSRMPKLSIINIRKLSGNFKDGDIVTPETLLKRGLIKPSSSGVKLLGDGAIGVKLTVKGCRLTGSAKAKILEAGGTVR